MYYDLNIPHDSASHAYFKRLEELGWGAVAINYTFAGKAPREPCQFVPHSDISMRQYTRLTIVLNDPQQNVSLNNSEIVRSFDILAVRPTTDRTFQIACQSLDVDIISLDLSDRVPFNIKHGLVREAIARGVMFEISYGPSISAPGSKRRAALSSVMHMTRVVGNAKGLVVSSGATAGEFCLRSPHCVRNWVELAGVKADSSLALLVDNNNRVVRHAGDRKWSVRGAIVNASRQIDSHMYADYIKLF
jgi:ribonuclease P/MRP protein subunit RPP1